MFQAPEQLVTLQKAAFESAHAIALKSVASFEKFAELNAQAAKANPFYESFKTGFKERINVTAQDTLANAIWMIFHLVKVLPG